MYGFGCLCFRLIVLVLNLICLWLEGNFCLDKVVISSICVVFLPLLFLFPFFCLFECFLFELVMKLGTKFSQHVMSLEASWIFISCLPFFLEVSCCVKLHDFSLEYTKKIYEIPLLREEIELHRSIWNITKCILNHDQLL